MTFGEKLRAARKAKKLTQKELASMIKAAHNSISNWENDQNMPDPDTIQYLCWALDVQPNYFFAHEDCLPPIPAGAFILSQEEQDIIEKFRMLDDRGKAAVLNVLKFEYNSLPGDKAISPSKEA